MSLGKNNTLANVTKESRKVEIITWGENKEEFLNYLHNMFSELLNEHYLQWDRDEVKLSTEYVETDIIRELHNSGIEEFKGELLEKVINNYSLKLIESLNLNAKNGLINIDIDASFGDTKSVFKKK